MWGLGVGKRDATMSGRLSPDLSKWHLSQDRPDAEEFLGIPIPNILLAPALADDIIICLFTFNKTMATGGKRDSFFPTPVKYIIYYRVYQWYRNLAYSHSTSTTTLNNLLS